jgi:hypothetical protein
VEDWNLWHYECGSLLHYSEPELQLLELNVCLLVKQGNVKLVDHVTLLEFRAPNEVLAATNGDY